LGGGLYGGDQVKGGRLSCRKLGLKRFRMAWETCLEGIGSQNQVLSTTER
jgi:hypothetical protein